MDKIEDCETQIFVNNEPLRVLKSEPVFEVLGNLDELNSFIGTAKNYTTSKTGRLLEKLQSDLIVIGGMIANGGKKSISEEDFNLIGKKIKEIKNKVGEINDFIIPGGTESSSYLDVCRSVCRRTERSAVRLHEKNPLDPMVLKYLNKLSTLFFLVARYEDKN